VGLKPTFFFPLATQGGSKKVYDQQIGELVEPVIVSGGMELVQLECLRMKTRWLLRIYIDRPTGVTIDDCAQVSNLVGDLLEVHNLPPGPFTLEVSSPGLNRPLVKDGDFTRFRGKRVKLELTTPLDKARNWTGLLENYVESGGEMTIILKCETRLLSIPRSQVKKANLVYEF
jgi:ribosome maturation factor RimP